jgi:hypothetical protein
MEGASAALARKGCREFTKKPSGSIETAGFMATRPTGLEPATSGVTGRCSNQLSYDPRSTLPEAATIEMRNYILLVHCCKSRGRRTGIGFRLELTAFFGCDERFREVDLGSAARVEIPDCTIRKGSKEATDTTPCGIDYSGEDS